MGGYEKAKETANKLKAEQVEEETKEVAQREEAVNQLQAIANNSTLAQMYNDSAEVGAKNLNSGSVPYLKVHAAGRSTSNLLSDGKKPNDGWFFYSPTQEQFETVTCHILTISKGFYAEGMVQPGKETKKVYNQIVGGVILDNGDYKPFLLFVTGMKLQPMWDFAKEASKWTKAKPVKIPMFALTVRLSTKEVTHNFGASWVINFELVKAEDGTPVIPTDEGEFQFLKDTVYQVEETINALVDAKAVDEDVHEAKVVTGNNTVEGEVAKDIPF